jgi:hypothetical protein
MKVLIYIDRNICTILMIKSKSRGMVGWIPYRQLILVNGGIDHFDNGGIAHSCNDGISHFNNC